MSVIENVPLILSWCVKSCINGSTLENEVERFKLNEEEIEKLSSYLEVIKRINTIGHNEQS